MDRHLVLSVHLHDRYHGSAEGSTEWPPSPARLFQALVAGAAQGDSLPADALAALDWLERQPAPVIAAPHAVAGQRIALYVPNNDADSLPDPTDVGSIRTRKLVEPRLPAHNTLHYAWPMREADIDHAEALVRTAESIYQLGRGVDMAWAQGTVLSTTELDALLQRYAGTVHHPTAEGTRVLPCPAPGSLQSLRARHAAPRLRTEGSGRRARGVFTNAPKPRFVGVGYDAVMHRRVYELRDPGDDTRLRAVPAEDVVAFVTRVRDAAALRLREAIPVQTDAVERALIGRKAEGSDVLPPSQRVRILPLPSIGHEHVDPSVRRIVVEVPSGAPLAAPEVWWAFSGLQPVDTATGEIDSDMILVAATDERMLSHYLRDSTRWHTVTPAALPARRRRIDPMRIREEAKPGTERANEETAARRAVVDALRHAGITAKPVSIDVQREPWLRRGPRAEACAQPPRFAKERLWHVAISFERSITGPLVIGDGRFLGLGLMAPVRVAPDAWVFEIDGVVEPAHAPIIARALRRATMSRWARATDQLALPAWVSGHADDGGATSDRDHLSFACDASRGRLLLIPPHTLNRRALRHEESDRLGKLDAALEGFNELRAGVAGILRLRRLAGLTDDDALRRPARVWTSVTPYVVDRHRRRGDASEAIRADVLAACQGVGLPIPQVDVNDIRSVPGRGLMACVRLSFAVAVAGPILLGRERYMGGGLFAANQ
jgi:CRISPR-associated protein Csb2